MTANTFFSVSKNLRLLFCRSDDRFKVIDGLRAWAILFVIFFHIFLAYIGTQFNYSSPEFLNFVNIFPRTLIWIIHGDKGVDLFFVISGFLLATALIKQYIRNGSIAIFTFYKRRLWRIMPVYLIILIIMGVISSTGREDMWVYLLFGQNYLPANRLLLHHTWSLCVEMHFYLILPIFISILFRFPHRFAILLITLIATAGYRLWVVLQNPDFYKVPIFKFLFDLQPGKEALYEVLYLDSFTRCAPLFLGVLLAYMHVYYKEHIIRYLKKHNILSNGLFLIALLIVGGIFYLPILQPASTYNSAFSPVIHLIYMAFSRLLFCIGMSILMLLSMYRLGWANLTRSIWSWSIWHPFSEMVLPLYLFHISFILIFGLGWANYFYDGELSSITLFDMASISILTLIATFFFSVIIHVFIERPGMKKRVANK